jgi:hypothetical protein
MHITRRHTLKTLGGALLGATASGTLFAEETRSKPTMHVYPDYGWVRGLGIVPSWGATVVEAWQLYDGARFREEIALAKQIHANSIRLWFEYEAW